MLEFLRAVVVGGFYLVDPLHVVTELFQILDVSITDLTDDKVSLPPALALAGLAGLVDGG